MHGYSIVRGQVPGALQRIVALHDSYYGEHWGFGRAFTEKNLFELSAFLDWFDADRDALWTVHARGSIEGSIAIDGSRAATDGAELRWFLVSDALRGRGAGARLLDAALGFCHDRGYGRVGLWTFKGLDRARQLYDAAGFELTEQRRGNRWGTRVLEQRLELDL